MPEPAPEVVQDDGEALAALAGGHQRSHWSDKHGWWWIACSCGWRGSDGFTSPEQWRAHRRAVFADWLARRDAQRDAEVAATALEQAADDADGEALPHPNIGGDWLDGACDVIDWLRDRAAHLRATGRAT